MARLVTAQPTFTMLVANIEGAGDPSQGDNPVKLRTGFRKQMFPEVTRGNVPVKVEDTRTPSVHTDQGLLDYTVSPIPVRTEVSVTVADNDFSAKATLRLGGLTVTSGVDFTVGGTTDLTAAALAAAVDGLPGFSASAVLSVVTIRGPVGPNGDNIRFDARYAGSISNYTLSPTTGFLGGGDPDIGPPAIL